MTSKRTKQCKTLSLILGIIHFVCLFGPLFYFVPYAYIVGTAGRKIFLSVFLVVSLCLSIISVITDAKTRGGLAKSVMWLIILGITCCLNEVKIFVYIMAIVSIIDELVVVRLRERYKNSYLANREIDKRG